MEKLTAIIVDDEFPARENLKILINEFCPEIKLLESCDNITDAKKTIETLKPNIVFLDIRMPSGIEGLELLESIEKKDFLVIFVTAFKEYAIRAFNASAIHYLLKPVDIDELINAVNKACAAYSQIFNSLQNTTEYKKSVELIHQQMSEKNSIKKITISHQKGIKVIDVASIIYLEAEGNCTNIYFNNDEKFLDTRTLKTYEEILPSFFYRIHKSNIVNLKFITDYKSQDSPTVVLNNGITLPVSHRRASDFTSAFKDFFSKKNA